MSDIDDYFVKAVRKHAQDPPCFSIKLRKKLRSAAVPKNGGNNDRTDSNLLFPPSIIQRVLFDSEENVKSVLGCKCAICKDPPGGRDIPSDATLTDVLTRNPGGEADDKRRSFSALLFMGAGFAVRHICTFYLRGLEIAGQRDILQQQLFQPLRERGFFQDPEDLATLFITIFKEAFQIFNAPKIDIGDYQKFVDVNLPFLNEKQLGDHSADRLDHGRFYIFEVHSEFRGQSVPVCLSYPKNYQSLILSSEQTCPQRTRMG